MNAIRITGMVITALFAACYAYQVYYMYVVWRGMLRNKVMSSKRQTAGNETANRVIYYHDFAVLICARNEEKVIADLIRSIRQQTYPAGHVHVFVMADNCTDNTAMVARRHGAKVYRRDNHIQVGKGYALEALFNAIKRDHLDGFDGYFVFDADNLMAPDYIEKMNKALCNGNEIVTCYRNSKNYGDNWISAGNALFFMRESRYMNQARYLSGASCAVSGTGFMLSRAVVEEMDGWHYHMLTEDIEFSMDQIAKGRRIAYCDEAEIFDEQPDSFMQSWRQRLRWTKGNIAVYLKYWHELLKGALHGSFACYDMAMSVIPAYFLSIASFVCALALGMGKLMAGEVTGAMLPLVKALLGSYCLFFVMGTVTTVTEWHHIRAMSWQKIVYMFSFPIFMMTYLPVSIASVFAKSEWKPITHNATADRITLYGNGVKRPAA